MSPVTDNVERRPFTPALPEQRAAVLWFGAVIMVAAFAPVFWFYASRVGHTLLENFNEGWNALFIVRALSGGPLYPGADEMLLNNYPPLSFYLVGLVAGLSGDAMTAGRLVSIAAFLVVALLIGFIVARRGRSTAAGVFACTFFALLFACFPGQRIGLNDPQLLGHACMVAGLVLVWLAPDRAPAIVAAAVLMILGGMVKHNLVAIPVATTLWMGWRGGRPLLVWLVSAVLAGAVALSILLALWGMPLLQSMTAPRNTSLVHAVAYSRKLVALIDIPLAAAVPGILSIEDRPDRVFAGLLLAAGLLEMVGFAGGDGVVANVAYDLVIAVALALGLAAAAVPRPAYLVGLLLFYFGLVLPVEQVRAALSGNPARASHEVAVRSDLAYIAAHPGPALCFDMALCWYAGQPPAFDEFNMGQQFAQGRRSPEPLATAFRSKHFAVVEVFATAMSGPSYALPPNAWGALMENYREDRRTEDRVFLVPKRD